MKPNQKTWGPFSGWQLTTMVCVVAAIMLFPVGAWAAVKFTNVSITDPGGVNRAKVDAAGQLQVGDGSSPLAVSGTVSGKPVLPAKPIVIPDTDVEGATIIYGPETKPFGISSLTLTNGCSSAQFFSLDAVTSSGNFSVQTDVLQPEQTTQLNFPTPLVTTPPAGGTASLQASGSSDCVIVDGVGIQS